jgi:hypothetical protein
MPRAVNANLFRPFEFQAMRHLLGPELSEAWLGKLQAEAALVSYEYSGCGYFLTVAHPMLPTERAVYSEPPVIGIAEDVQAGFLVFVENNELMLECHTWGSIEIPADFRDTFVQVSVGAVNTVRVQGGAA